MAHINSKIRGSTAIQEAAFRAQTLGAGLEYSSALLGLETSFLNPSWWPQLQEL